MVAAAREEEQGARRPRSSSQQRASLLLWLLLVGRRPARCCLFGCALPRADTDTVAPTTIMLAEQCVAAYFEAAGRAGIILVNAADKFQLF